MRREIRTARPQARAKVEHLGLTFHTLEGQPYWFEEAAYIFTEREIHELESATQELHERCLDAVEHVIAHDDFRRFGIPEPAWSVIRTAWEADPPAIYGRFDLAYDGQSPPKMLEYNADTPTSLLEAAVVQWHWLQDVNPSADQFNFIWEALIAKWKELRQEGYFKLNRVHFASMDCDEDLMTTAVMMDTAQEAGLEVIRLFMPEIHWDDHRQEFLDQNLSPIYSLFKLYPWEWLIAEEFGPYALSTYSKVNWIEPIWKLVLSNKAFLAVLWELFPDHPNLLPAYQDSPRGLDAYVKKALLGREGANVEVVTSEVRQEVDGPYEESGYVFQAYAPLAQFDGNYAVIGSWVVDGIACGIGIRESNQPITQDTARFVPHYFLPETKK